MVKRLLLIGVLSISMMALSRTNLNAYSVGGGVGMYVCNPLLLYTNPVLYLLLGCGSNIATWEVRGGQKPGTTTTFFDGEYGIEDMYDAAVVCTNNAEYDVRYGGGGTTTIDISSADAQLLYDGRGKYKLNQPIPTSRYDFDPCFDYCFCAKWDPATNADEYECEQDPAYVPGVCPDNPYTEECYTACQDLCDMQEAFNRYWKMYPETHCRNKNWDPYLFALMRVRAQARVLRDCVLGSELGDFVDPIRCYEDGDPEKDPCFCNQDLTNRNCECIDGYGTPISASLIRCNCDLDDESSIWYCQTDVDPRYWIDHDIIHYLCTQQPVAIDDSYTTDKNTTLVANGLNGNPEGVLTYGEADTDPDGDDLTAVLVAGPSNGRLTLNLDGTFTYKPNKRYCDDDVPDSFTYKATDGIAEDEAKVEITVFCPQ
jgi:hypothetical protein